MISVSESSSSNSYRRVKDEIVEERWTSTSVPTLFLSTPNPFRFIDSNLNSLYFRIVYDNFIKASQPILFNFKHKFSSLRLSIFSSVLISKNTLELLLWLENKLTANDFKLTDWLSLFDISIRLVNYYLFYSLSLHLEKLSARYLVLSFR